MNKYIIVSIDVEPDCSTNWYYSNPLTIKGVKIGIDKILQPLFNSIGVRPTYLINNVVLENNDAINVFKKLKGDFELGTHLHPEFIEPRKEVSTYAGTKGIKNLCFYSKEIEHKKIENITTLFYNKFGFNPRAFRAGRFSAGENTLNSLFKLGYKVDSSATPHICWNDSTREFPVDFSNVPEQPYYTLNFKDVLPKNKGILEVPITIQKLKNNLFSEMLKSGLGFRRKIYYKSNYWLRPSSSSLREMKRLKTIAEQKYNNKDLIVLNMMFHNVEVIPGMSPYTKTAKATTYFIKRLERILSLCKEEGYKFITLSEVPNIL